MYLLYIFPLSPTHLWLRCSNFFNPSKKNSFGCAPNREIGKAKDLSAPLRMYLWLCSPLLGLGRFFSFLILHTVGRTPWAGDQPVVRPLPTHRINAETSMPSVGFEPRTQNSSYLRPRGHCDWHVHVCLFNDIVASNVKLRSNGKITDD
jgi:hypothetical protein